MAFWCGVNSWLASNFRCCTKSPLYTHHILPGDHRRYSWAQPVRRDTARWIMFTRNWIHHEIPTWIRNRQPIPMRILLKMNSVCLGDGAVGGGYLQPRMSPRCNCNHQFQQFTMNDSAAWIISRMAELSNETAMIGILCCLRRHRPMIESDAVAAAVVPPHDWPVPIVDCVGLAR